MNIYDHQDRRPRISAPSIFRQRVERGFIHVNEPGYRADEFEDEIFVRTGGRVEFRLMSGEDGVGAGIGVGGGGGGT